MKLIRQITGMLILLVFLYGTTGITVFHHVCNGSEEETTSLYPEIAGYSGPSCCADEDPGRVILPDPHAPLVMEPVPCCKSTSSYLKMRIITVRTEKQEPVIITAIPSFVLPETPVCDNEQAFLYPSITRNHAPPPWSGKKLIHYLHQIKIPAGFISA